MHSSSKKRAWLVAALLATASACGGAPPSPEAPVVAMAAPREGHALPLWRIESPDGQTSYALGTYHLGVHIDEVLPPAQAAALDRARVLLVELDVTNVDPQALLAYALLPPEQDLHDMVPPHVWPRLVSELAETLPQQALHRFRPWFVMSLVMAREASRQEAERRDGASGGEEPSLLDAQVMERARANGVEVVSLETLDEQGALMSELPTDLVVQYIERSLDPQSHGSESTLAALSRAYLGGDDAALEAIIFDLDEWGGSEELLDRLVFARNARWLDRVEAQVRQGGAFIGVGMAHLIGERGLVHLLEERGYTCVRVRADP